MWSSRDRFNGDAVKWHSDQNLWIDRRLGRGIPRGRSDGIVDPQRSLRKKGGRWLCPAPRVWHTGGMWHSSRLPPSLRESNTG